MTESGLARLTAVSTTRLAALRRVAWWLDESIPIPFTRYRFGLDPLIGLLPGLGDAIGLVLGLWIVGEAVGVGAPRATLTRMMLNLASDALFGTVPILGDLWDAARKSNIRNIALLDRHLADPTRAKRADGGYLVLLGSGVLLTTAATVAGGFFLARWLIGPLFGL